MASIDIREFETGATRSAQKGKLEYRRFLSPTVLRRYAEFMDANRVQPDGSLRDPDNWKMGIPLDSYMDSIARHYMELWLLHDGDTKVMDEKGKFLDREVVLCSIMFNAMGYLHEYLKENK